MKPSAWFAAHPVFRVEEFIDAHAAAGRSRRGSESVLRQHVLAGHLIHVRRGLYATVPAGVPADRAPVDPYLLASRLTADAVVAFHAALQFHGYAYSSWRRYDYLTASRDQPLHFRGADFTPAQEPATLRQRKDRGGGIETRHHSGGEVRVTILERTLVDVLDAPERIGDWEEIWRSLSMVPFLDLDLVVWLVQAGRPAITAARVGFFLDHPAHREALFVTEAHLAPLRALAPRQPRYLDRRRTPGRLVRGWNLIVPETVLEQDWEEPHVAELV